MGKPVAKSQMWKAYLALVIALGVLAVVISVRPNSNYALDNGSVSIPDYDNDINQGANLPDTTTPEPANTDTAEQLLTEFQDMLLDEGLDALVDILEKVLDEINEAADNGHWEKANDWYERADECMKKGGAKGTALLQRYEEKLAKTKINIISKNPNPNMLPDSRELDDGINESSYAIESIANKTGYFLTIYYTGPTNKIVTISPGGTEEVLLNPGSYTIVAKVGDPSIQESYSTRVFRGFRYGCDYYID